MGRLTVDERRRLFMEQQQRRQKAFAPLPTRPGASGRRATASGRASRLQDLVKIAVTAVLLAGGSIVWRVVELHLPMSLLDARLPRV